MRNFRQIFRAGVAQRDRGVLVDQQLCSGLAHQLTAANHHHVLARNLYVVGFQQRQNAFRSTRHHIRLSQMQQPDVHQVKSVGILAVVDEIKHPRGVVMVGQR